MTNRLAVARHHLDTDNPQRALDVISQLGPDELAGAEAEAYEIAADAKLQMNDPAGAGEFARRALAVEPDNLEVLRTLAWSAALLGDGPTAWSSMDRARVLAPSSVVVLVDCVLLLIREGRASESAELLARAAAIAPDDIVVKTAQMEHAFATGFRQRARSLAQEILAQRPDDSRALAMDAYAAEREGDICTTAQRMRRLASLRLGDLEIAAGAREATAWSQPLLRPAWWLIQRGWGRWLGVSAAIAVVRLTMTWFDEKEMPVPPLYVPLVVVVAYLGLCLAWVDEKKSGPAKKWVPRDE